MPGHPGACFCVASACTARSRERSGLRHLWYVCVRSFSDLTASALLLSPRAGRAFLMDPATCCPAPQTRDDASRLATTVIVEGPSSRIVASPSGSQCPVRQRYYARVTSGTIICVNGMVVIGVASSRRARWSAAIRMSGGSRFRCRLAYRADVSKSPLSAADTWTRADGSKYQSGVWAEEFVVMDATSPPPAALLRRSIRTA